MANKKLKLLYLARYLREETDERHRYGADSSATSAFSLVSGDMVCYSTILFFPERNGWCGRRNLSLTLFQAWSYPILRKLSHFQTQTYILLPQHYSIELYWADTP